MSILKCDGAINVDTNDGPSLENFILIWRTLPYHERKTSQYHKPETAP